jgi:hypothetical protein
VACSSSSINDRYNRPKEKKIESDSSSRFSSENDEKTYLSEFDEEPVEDFPVDVEEFVLENNSNLSTTFELTIREKIMMEIVRYLNTPYQYGGNDGKGIDCSAFTKNVFENSIDLLLPRTASEQYRTGQEISNKYQLKFGDLLFFNTTKNSYPGHVGIFLGDDLFAHASFSKGVTISSLKSSYFNSRYIGAKRTATIN